MWIDNPQVDSQAMFLAFAASHRLDNFREIAEYLPLSVTCCGAFDPHHFICAGDPGTTLPLSRLVKCVPCQVLDCPWCVIAMEDSDDDADFIVLPIPPRQRGRRQQDLFPASGLQYRRWLKTPNWLMDTAEELSGIGPCHFHWFSSSWSAAYLRLAAMDAWRPSPTEAP